MTSGQIAAVVEGLIPLFGGATASLYAFRVLGKRPGSDSKWDDWHRRYGTLLRICGPLLILFGIGTIAAPFVAARSEVESLSTFPVRVGATWTYAAGTGEVQGRIAAHERINEILWVRRELSLNGKVIHVEHVRPDQGTLYKLGANGVVFSPPLPLLKDVPGSATWDYRPSNGMLILQCEQKAGGPLKTPLKQFDHTVLVTQRGKDRTGETLVESWYAPGVGLVREHTQSKSGEILLELKSFSP